MGVTTGTSSSTNSLLGESSTRPASLDSGDTAPDTQPRSYLASKLFEPSLAAVLETLHRDWAHSSNTLNMVATLCV